MTAQDAEPVAPALEAASFSILLDYCNLEWHENCLRYFESGRAVLTASAVQVRQPINTKSVGLWERYKEGLQPLLSVLESP